VSEGDQVRVKINSERKLTVSECERGRLSESVSKSERVREKERESTVS
jgi:hypothetical protein